VFSVVIMVIVLFYRQGLMGTKEFSWDAIFAFFGKIGRFFKNLVAEQRNLKGADHGGVIQEAQPPLAARHIQEGAQHRTGDGADAADDDDEDEIS